MDQKNDPSKVTKRIDPINMMALTEDTISSFGNDFRVLPLFEKKIFEHTRKKQYSLESNGFLKQRWRRFTDKTDARQGPIQFPGVRDFHFYLGDARYIPSQSLSSRATFRMHLAPGPGFDYRGSRPVPDDMLMKRGEKKKEEAGKNQKAGGKKKEAVAVGKKEPDGKK